MLAFQASALSATVEGQMNIRHFFPPGVQFKEQNTVLHAPTSNRLRLLCTAGYEHCSRAEWRRVIFVTSSQTFCRMYSATIRFRYLYILAVKVAYIANDNFIYLIDLLIILHQDDIS